jgi:hypothetical protein
MEKMKSNTKAKLFLVCLGALFSLSFVISSNVANFSGTLSNYSVSSGLQNLENPYTSTNGADKILWSANGTKITDSQDIYDHNYRIISDGQGGAIIAFQVKIGANKHIYAQKINSNGDRLWGVNGTIICNALINQNHIAICSDGSGGAIITWEDYRVNNNDIYAQHVDSDGTTYWGESWWSGPGDRNGTVICNATDDQYSPQICEIEGGGAIIVWQDTRPASFSDIYAQKVSSDGTTYWGDGLTWDGNPDRNGTLICNATSYQGEVQICSDEANGAIITWNDLRAGNMDIYAQHVDSDGTTYWGDESTWDGNPDRNGTVICNATNTQDWPKICASEGGGAIITWEDYRYGVDDYYIFAQKVSSDGTTHWGESWWSGPGDRNGTVICNATGGQYDYQICSDGANGAIITWDDYRVDNHDIYAQHVDFDGITYWGESWWSGPGDRNGTVICNATNDQIFPSICAVGGGGAIIAWTDRRAGNYDIYAQDVSIDGTTYWGDGSTWGGNPDRNGTAICNVEGKWAKLNDGSGSPADPSICSDNNNGVIVAWWDWRGTGISMYAQRVESESSGGAVLPVGAQEDEGNTGIVGMVVIIILASVGGIVVIMAVLIQKGIINISKCKRT